VLGGEQSGHLILLDHATTGDGGAPLAGLPLAGLRVVVDCAHGAAYELAPRLLSRAGADVIPIGTEPDGLNINDGVGSTWIGSLAGAVRGADTVVVATSSETPVLRGEWLSPGAHVNAVGACRPDWRELDDATLRRGRLYVDSREAAVRESGDVIAAREVVAEIGEVIAGTRPGRQSDEEVTLFKSVGVAVEDVMAADMVYRATLAPSEGGDADDDLAGPYW